MLSSTRGLLGRIGSKQFLPFEEARAYMRSVGLTSWNQWTQWRSTKQRPRNIPTNPYVVYKGEFVDSPDWLGYVPYSRKVRQLGDCSKDVKHNDSIKKSQELQERFMELVHSEAGATDIEFRKLRMGEYQATLLFRISEASKKSCQPQKNETSHPSNANRAIESKSDGLSPWLPLQVKLAFARLNGGETTLEVNSLSKAKGVGIIAIAYGASHSFFSLSPHKRNLSKRRLLFRESDCTSLQSVVSDLRSWWANGEAERESELLQRIASRPLSSLRERIHNEIREGYYAKCGLSFKHVSVLHHATNGLLDERHRLIFRLGNKRKGEIGISVFRYRLSYDSVRAYLPISPDDTFDFFVVPVVDDSAWKGFFFFPKHILMERKFLGVKPGERAAAAMLYTPTVKPNSQRAREAQKWQCEYWVTNLEEFKDLGRKLKVLPPHDK